ncbi:MAG: NAD-dependent epimerase/dehydratase family protein [Leptospiraceae bacterium]|nr:NAD-dependent epimerase/dehydratase family protein [Leptospiraceae bacterium]MCK6381309.1 NAD-dependent epimerase/dehydratase family protein [Leptospiraceae bacterium]NUM40788.1 NAD-dependent epimerase/dehydratase family protein [Leptospiraceae bacterium]
MKVFITGGSGYIGSNLVRSLAKKYPNWDILSSDIKPTDEFKNLKKVKLRILDISNRIETINEIKKMKPDSIVHLASIINPPPGMSEETQRKIDVEGTRNVLDGALLAKTRQIIITSSGAAYGYYKDNPEWIKETDLIRGHDHFAYSKHKKEVEEMLSLYRKLHPKLTQLVLRPGTVLGPTVNNLITDLFNKKSILGISGSKSPFVFIWDKDLVNIILLGIEKKKTGVFNLAGDGALSMPEIAKILGKPYKPKPAWLLKLVLGILKPLKLSQYGPEQLDFLRYRPVLDNTSLKKDFGYKPKYTSKQAFYEFLKSKGVDYNEI